MKLLGDQEKRQVVEQGPLTSVPDSKEFQKTPSKLNTIPSLIVILVLFTGVVFIAVDPIFVSSTRIVTAVTAAFIGVVLIAALWKQFGKRISVAAIGAAVLVLIMLGAYLFIESKPPPAAGTDILMIAQQEVALRCLEEGKDLLAKKGRWGRGEPTIESPICSGESVWKKLPPGWKYTIIVDADVSDGTFAFGAHSRAGDYIFCGEKWCALRDAGGGTTILSTVSGPISVTAVLPQSGNVRPGEEVEIAQITVANTTDEPVDLDAFWYKKSGTASDAAIEMVYIEDGDGTFGTNYLYDLNSSRSTEDGMVYIRQPEMFLIGPRQSRTYSVLIGISAKARAEAGKTIGLDLVGFSYDPQPTGMPAPGAVHTIQ